MDYRNHLGADRPDFDKVPEAPPASKRVAAEIERLAELGHGLIADEPIRPPCGYRIGLDLPPVLCALHQGHRGRHDSCI